MTKIKQEINKQMNKGMTVSICDGNIIPLREFPIMGKRVMY